MQDWLNKQEIDKYNCNLVSSNGIERYFFDKSMYYCYQMLKCNSKSVFVFKRSIGTEEPIDVNNKNLQQLIPFIAQSLTKFQGSKNLLSVIQVQKATKQVSAMVYNAYFCIYI